MRSENEDFLFLLVLGDYVSLGNRCQAGIKYMKILSGRTICERKWGGSLARLGELSVHETSLTPGGEREEEMGESVSDCHSVRKVQKSLSQSSHQKFPVSPRSGPAFTISAALCHWLGAAHGKHGLGINVLMDFRAWELSISYIPGSWGSGKHSHGSHTGEIGTCQQEKEDPNCPPGPSEDYSSLSNNLKAGPGWGQN